MVPGVPGILPREATRISTIAMRTTGMRTLVVTVVSFVYGGVYDVYGDQYRSAKIYNDDDKDWRVNTSATELSETLRPLGL